MTARNPVAVLVSTSRHPLSGHPCVSRNDSLALELGRRLSAGAVRVLHAGDPEDPALADYLALGAPVIEVLPASPGDDLVPMLVPEARETPLILCGNQSERGAASGMLPYLLAATLNRPVLTDALDVRLGTDGQLGADVQLGGNVARVVQFLPKGRRRQVELPLPAVVAIHPFAPVIPRYAYARRVTGRIETLTASTSHDPDSAAWRIDNTERLPVPLKAPDRRTGHARMATATASARRGGQVVIEGSDVAKAQVVLTYLRDHGLIDF